MKRVIAAGAALLLALTALIVQTGGSANAGATQGVRLNEMQVIGSHNSYHVEPPPETLEFYLTVDPDAIDLAYSHRPLPQQFAEQGVRQIELDIFADPAGDLWSPIGVPGFKVQHIEQIDEGATCETLVACLSLVKGWSDTHQQHMPLAILLESKDAVDFPALPDPLPIGTPELDALDDEILSVFPENRIITPDDVRGSHATLEEAVLADGWPEIDDERGKVMFMLDNKRDEYRAGGHPSLQGRVAFTPSAPGQEDAAFLKLNDPLDPLVDIPAAVAAGYIVRTRADNRVAIAQNNDTTMRDAALASGAQWVSTDYPVPGIAARWNGSPYAAQIPGGTPARCNPVNAPPGCENTDIENLPPDPVPTSTSPTTLATNVSTSPRFTG
jgi:hypothetical protein